MSYKTESHEERIICPECENEQAAVVEHTIPWPSYVHVCEFCDYIIMESEWERAAEETAVS
jgi:ribosomal protein S27E